MQTFFVLRRKILLSMLLFSVWSLRGQTIQSPEPSGTIEFNNAPPATYNCLPGVVSTKFALSRGAELLLDSPWTKVVANNGKCIAAGSTLIPLKQPFTDAEKCIPGPIIVCSSNKSALPVGNYSWSLLYRTGDNVEHKSPPVPFSVENWVSEKFTDVSAWQPLRGQWKFSPQTATYEAIGDTNGKAWLALYNRSFYHNPDGTLKKLEPILRHPAEINVRFKLGCVGSECGGGIAIAIRQINNNPAPTREYLEVLVRSDRKYLARIVRDLDGTRTVAREVIAPTSTGAIVPSEPIDLKVKTSYLGSGNFSVALWINGTKMTCAKYVNYQSMPGGGRLGLVFQSQKPDEKISFERVTVGPPKDGTNGSSDYCDFDIENRTY